MIVQISGTRQQIAELAQELRLRGHRFDHNTKLPPQAKKHSLIISSYSNRLCYYKNLEPYEISSNKRLQAQLPTHRKHFIKLVEEHHEPTTEEVSQQELSRVKTS